MNVHGAAEAVCRANCAEQAPHRSSQPRTMATWCASGWRRQSPLSASFCSTLICVLKQCMCCIPTAEDDGYLVCYLMEEVNGKTQLAVFDAKTMDSKPLATVDIPHRVRKRGSQSFPAASTYELTAMLCH